MQNNVNQQLQQYSNRIRNCIQNAGYQVLNTYEYISTEEVSYNHNGIALLIKDQSGRNMEVRFEQMDNNQWNYRSKSFSPIYSFDNFDTMLASFNHLLQNNALTSTLEKPALERRIRDMSRSNGHRTAMGIVRYHNDEMNKMEMLIYTPSDHSMHLDLERTPYGQWKLTNRDLEQEGRIFQNIDDAFQSIRDRLRSAAWINYNGNNINVNNGQPNHQINVNYPINNYNGPN